jgi:hypothetical protein
VSAVGNVLYALLILTGVGGGSLFVTAIAVWARGRRTEVAAQEQLRLEQEAAYEDHRDRVIMREAIDEVRREDLKNLIRRASAGVTQ